MGTHPLSSRLPDLLKGVRQYKHSGHQQAEDLRLQEPTTFSCYFLLFNFCLPLEAHWSLCQRQNQRPILITIIKMLYIATALIKFPKRRLIIRDACSMRFTEGSQFSMNVKDKHKNRKYVHKVSLTQNQQTEKTRQISHCQICPCLLCAVYPGVTLRGKVNTRFLTSILT